jgi:hypothetical protein
VVDDESAGVDGEGCEEVSGGCESTLGAQLKQNPFSNHGSFYFNQLASLQVLVGDTTGAKATIEEYFTGIFQDQIAANGDQPLETARTRPYHYRAYNLAAMVVNAKIGEHVGLRDAWNRTGRSGGLVAPAYAHELPFDISRVQLEACAERQDNVR